MVYTGSIANNSTLPEVESTGIITEARPADPEKGAMLPNMWQSERNQRGFGSICPYTGLVNA